MTGMHMIKQLAHGMSSGIGIIHLCFKVDGKFCGMNDGCWPHLLSSLVIPIPVGNVDCRQMERRTSMPTDTRIYTLTTFHVSLSMS